MDLFLHEVDAFSSAPSDSEIVRRTCYGEECLALVIAAPTFFAHLVFGEGARLIQLHLRRVCHRGCTAVWQPPQRSFLVIESNSDSP